MNLIPKPALALVVEDDAPTLKFVQRTLAGNGFQVMEATTGEAALELFQAHHPDLLVLDILLPGIDGFQVCRSIRESGSDAAILMLTSKGDEADKVRGLELGADDYMVKPFSPTELVARLQAILRRMHRVESGQEPHEHRGIRMEFRLQKCFKEGREVDLTPREFVLLSELLRNAGQPLSRESLSTSLWGRGHHGSPKSLDVYIRRLREKIEDVPADPTLIRTVWGYGYVCE